MGGTVGEIVPICVGDGEGAAPFVIGIACDGVPGMIEDTGDVALCIKRIVVCRLIIPEAKRGALIVIEEDKGVFAGFLANTFFNSDKAVLSPCQS